MVGSKEQYFSYSKGLQEICFKRKLVQKLPPSLDETAEIFLWISMRKHCQTVLMSLFESS